MFDVVGKAISSIIEVITNLPKIIIDGIVGFFTDPLGVIVDGINAVVGFFGSLIDALIDMFKSIFIPSDGYFDNKVKGLQTNLNSKIDIDSYKKAMDGLTGANKVSIKSQRFSFLGTSINIDVFGFIDEYKDIFQWIIRAIAFWALLQYNINNVYKLIRGGSLDDGGDD